MENTLVSNSMATPAAIKPVEPSGRGVSIIIGTDTRLRVAYPLGKFRPVVFSDQRPIDLIDQYKVIAI